MCRKKGRGPGASRLDWEGKAFAESYYRQTRNLTKRGTDFWSMVVVIKVVVLMMVNVRGVVRR